MYRSSNNAENKEYLDFLKDNVAIEDKSEANKSWNYYQRTNYILDLNDYLRASTKENIEIGFGNVLSGVVFVLDTINNKDAMTFLRGLFKKLNMEYYDVYFTSLNKSSNSILNTDVLNKELKTINPKVVICYDNVAGALNINSEMHVINSNEFNYMLSKMNDMDNLSQEEKENLQTVKNKVWSELKHMIKGYTPIYKE